VLSGTVERVASGTATALTGTGARIEVALRGSHVAPGGQIFGSVRRDRIAVRRRPPVQQPMDLVNAVAGEVHAIENQGSYVKVTLDLGDSEEFVANVLDEDYFVDPIDIGEPVIASWAARDVRLLEDGGTGGAGAVAIAA
jgi:putative spermidine/putrescine transport system ATP-binding protein